MYDMIPTVRRSYVRERKNIIRARTYKINIHTFRKNFKLYTRFKYIQKDQRSS